MGADIGAEGEGQCSGAVGSIVAVVFFVVGEHVLTGVERRGQAGGQPSGRLFARSFAHPLATPFEHKIEVRNTAARRDDFLPHLNTGHVSLHPALTTFTLSASSLLTSPCWLFSFESLQQLHNFFPFLPSCASSSFSSLPPSFNCHPVSEIELSSSCPFLLSASCAVTLAGSVQRRGGPLAPGDRCCSAAAGAGSVATIGLSRRRPSACARETGGAAQPILHSHIRVAALSLSDSDVLSPLRLKPRVVSWLSLSSPSLPCSVLCSPIPTLFQTAAAATALQQRKHERL